MSLKQNQVLNFSKNTTNLTAIKCLAGKEPSNLALNIEKIFKCNTETSKDMSDLSCQGCWNCFVILIIHYQSIYNVYFYLHE